MLLNHHEGQDTLVHVLKNIFQVCDDHPLALALREHGYNMIHDILDAPHEDIESLTYMDDQGNVIPLPLSYHFLVYIFILYSKHHQKEGDPIGDKWATICAQEFNNFHQNTDPSHPNLIPWTSHCKSMASKSFVSPAMASTTSRSFISTAMVFMLLHPT